MGCGGFHGKNTLDYIHIPLDTRIKQIGIASIDDDFIKGKAFITDLEQIRELIIDNRDHLILKSGACAYNYIDMKAIISSFMLVLSVYLDCRLRLTKRNFTDHYPFLYMGFENNTKSDKLYKCFMKYLMDLKKAEEKLVMFIEPYREYTKHILNSKQEYIEQASRVYADDRTKL
jgi:hypothetical protein